MTSGHDLVKLLTVDCKDVTGGIMHVETDTIEAVDAMLEYIEANRKKL